MYRTQVVNTQSDRNLPTQPRGRTLFSVHLQYPVTKLPYPTTVPDCRWRSDVVDGPEAEDGEDEKVQAEVHHGYRSPVHHGRRAVRRNAHLRDLPFVACRKIDRNLAKKCNVMQFRGAVVQFTDGR